MLTVLPDLYLIWKSQRQMVADIFALHGRTAELTRTHMLYCLFRHLASQVLRDVVVRAGQRVVVQQLSAGALEGRARDASASAVTQRVAGHAGGALGAARRRRRGRRLRVLGHAAGREDRAPPARPTPAARRRRRSGATRAR